MASGRSNEELRHLDRAAFDALDRFRARVVPASGLMLPGGETVESVHTRLQKWWADEGETRTRRRVIFGSSSTALMIAHYLDGVLPTDPEYLFLGMPNGSARIWLHEDGGWRPSQRGQPSTWPDVELRRLPSGVGSVAISRHAASWDPKGLSIVIVPGYFGSSRHGPYGLYSRLARTWAWHGYETITVDPIGSGDSSPVHRDFDSEVRSVEIAYQFARERTEHVLLVGHSMGGATALKARERIARPGVKVWCFAPLCRMRDLAGSFFSAESVRELRDTGVTRRHGLELRKEMIDASEKAWAALSTTVDAVWVADDDPYTRTVDLSAIPRERIHHVARADHNFATGDSVATLAASTTAALESLDGRLDGA